MEKSEKPKRKTFTSNAVKDRWNKKHYETLLVYVPIGAKSQIQELAKKNNISVSEYIRQAIKEKAMSENNSNIITELN